MSILSDRIKQEISIPAYFKEFVDASINLDDSPKICCPFHNEDTPSFSYSADKGLWRCWGACHVGGDVIALHRKNYHLESTEAAVESLAKILGISMTNFDFTFKPPKVSKSLVDFKVACARAQQLAKDTEQYLELDYIMSQFTTIPDTTMSLNMFCDKYRK